jgi:Kef-type K+ transport system membrane component KefB
VPLLVLLTGVLGRSWFPFAAGLGTGDLILVGLLFGALLAVNSPMVTLALLTETRAEGPVAKTVLGVVLVADVAVIFLLSFLLGIAQGNLGGDAPSLWAVLFGVVKDVGVSLVAGAVVGGLLTLYLRYVRQELVLFAVLIVFAAAGAAGALHFELMLSLLVAGFLVENVAPVRAEPLLRALSDIAWPVFVVFFALAGAELPVAAFLSLWPVVVGVAGIRALGIWLAARVGTRRGRAEPAVASWAWLGLVSQAGVALGLATIVADRLPGVGVAIQLITVGVIAVNETVGPVLFRLALARAQELGPGEVEVVEIAPSPLRPA